MKKDNTTFHLKKSLRLKLLKEIAAPVVMETHGGYGKIWAACYWQVAEGVVFEKDATKADILGKQRPHWAVYEADCLTALSGSAGAHLPVNFLDLDPYGEPWPVLEAFFESERPFPDTLAIAVNDGLRQGLRMGKAWSVGSLAKIVGRYGNEWIHDNYLDVCQELIQEITAQRGYSLRRWAGYYCGHADQMTHYAGVFTR